MKKGVCQEAERTTDIDAWLAASKNGAHILHFPVVLQQNNFITIKKTVISRLMVTKFQEKKLKKSTNIQLFPSGKCLQHPMMEKIQHVFDFIMKSML